MLILESGPQTHGFTRLCKVSSGKIGVGEEKSNKPRSLTVPILQCFGKYFAKGFSG